MDFYTLPTPDDREDPSFATKHSEVLEFGEEQSADDAQILDFEICKGLSFTLD